MWCEEERRLFQEATAKQTDHDRRIFVVNISNVAHDRWPDQFRNPSRTGYRFWERDDRTDIVRPVSMEFGSDARFPQEFERLADDLFTQLNRLLPSRSKWNIEVEGKQGHCFVREENGFWIQLPARWPFREER